MIEIAKVRVTGANVRCNGSKIPRGMAGAYISVQYDPVWDNLVKTVVFKGSSTIDVVTNKNIIEVPHEVLQSVGKRVYIGFYGTAATGKVIIPTFWAELGTVVESTDPSGDESTDPALPVYAALTEQVGDLEEAQVNIKTAAESAMKAATEADKKAGNAKEQADNAIRNINTLREVVSKFHSNIVEKASGETIILDDASDMELAGLKVYGRTTQNGTPTPETPVPLDSVGDDGSVNVIVSGKNLFSAEWEQGGIDTAGYEYASTSIVRCGYVAVLPLTTYALSRTITTANIQVRGYDADKNFIGSGAAVITLVQGTSVANPMTAGVRSCVIKTNDNVHYLRYADVSNDLTTKYQMEIGSTVTAYEPYKETQTLSISTPNGLPGIPVASGGNYTDESGQQWICDEVDFEKGVYVQRVAVHHVADVNATNNGASWKENISQFMGALQVPGITNTQCLLTHGDSGIWFDNDYLYAGIGNNLKFIIGGNRQKLGDTVASCNAYLNALNASVPIKLLYIRETPLETALSAEQLAAFTALHTNYPNTTVFNEESANMEVKYVADTKLYIDKKFDQLAAAMLNN